MKSILLLIVSIAAINCLSEFCSVLYPNGIYSPIGGMYWEWFHRGEEEFESEFRMYGNGKEWRFGLVVDSNNERVVFVYYANWPIDPNIKSKFCHQNKYKANKEWKLWKQCCQIVKDVNLYTTQCWDTFNYNYSDKFPLNTQVLVFNAKIGTKSTLANNAFVVWEKEDRELHYKYNYYSSDLSDDCDFCEYPKFIDQIGKDRQLDGITDYDDKGNRGHFLVFNVNGIPMYCITPEKKILSRNCQPDKLKVLGDYCWNATARNVKQRVLTLPPIPTEPETKGDSTIVWIIVPILIILLVGIILIVIWGYLRNKRRFENPKISETKSTSAVTSKSTEGPVIKPEAKEPPQKSVSTEERENN